ncbi:MAG: Fe-S cluster assembly protein SufD [Gammaproteobacteria bacterium]|nr:Fe-S cluster assembly protein SufD [Gammaproteobacteria bacterium]
MHARVRAGLPGRQLPWLEKIRRRALECFAEQGFPRPGNEAWKYTQLRTYARRTFAPSAKMPETKVLSEEMLPETESGTRLAFINGHYAAHLSRQPALPGGAVLTNLAEALAQHPEHLEAQLGQYADAEAEGLTALNTAFMSDGAYLYVPKGVALDDPVHLVFIADNAENLLLQPRSLIVAEAESRVTLIEHYVGAGAYFTNAVTEIAAGAGSHVEHYKLQEESHQALHVAALQTRQAQDSRFDSLALMLGGALARNAVYADMNAEGGECTLHGLHLLSGRQHADSYTRIAHNKPHCTSREVYKGVLEDFARGVFSGRVVVLPDAQKTDARQACHNLLLSDNAEADARPQLEIYADDVKCSHGATAGRLDEEALFYLRSRGMDAETARGLLIYAFAKEVLDFVGQNPLRKMFEKHVLAKLPCGTYLHG